MSRTGTRLLLWISAIGLVILAASAAGAVLLMDSGPPGMKKEPQWLHVRLGPTLRDAPGNEGLLADPSDLPPLTSEVTAALRHAATDAEIAGLFLEIDPVDLGWAQAQELRGALAGFRASEKPCVAWGEIYTNREYYLASACEKVLIPPAGLTLVNGLALTQVYFKQAFDKYGVTANFEHVGDYKSAVEPFERTGPSEAAAVATESMLDSLYGQLVAGIAEGRGLSPEEAAALIDDPPMTPAAAVERAMVDGIAFRDEVIDQHGGDEQLPLREYLKDRREEWKRGDTVIAILHADGTIINGESDQDVFGDGYVGDRTVRKQLRRLREDDDVAAVVLRVNSPGGSGSASDSIWRELELLRAEKPVVVSMGDYAASGGYYISMGADRIFAEPGTLTGSIGVFGGKMNLAGTFGKVGLDLHTWQRGRYARLLSSTSDFDADERAKFRGFLDGFYQTFLDRAAQGREMSVDEVHAVAQGRVWTGEQAVQNGLVDEIGGLEAAFEAARQLANAPEKVGVRRIPERKGLLEQVMEELSAPEEDKAAAVDARLVRAIGGAEAVRSLVRLERVLAGDRVAALLPVGFEVR